MAGGTGALWSVGGGVTPLVYVIMLATVREADLLQNGGWDHSIQKFTSQIFAIIDVTSVMNFGKIWIF